MRSHSAPYGYARQHMRAVAPPFGTYLEQSGDAAPMRPGNWPRNEPLFQFQLALGWKVGSGSSVGMRFDVCGLDRVQCPAHRLSFLGKILNQWVLSTAGLLTRTARPVQCSSHVLNISGHWSSSSFFGLQCCGACSSSHARIVACAARIRDAPPSIRHQHRLRHAVHAAVQHRQPFASPGCATAL